MNGINGTQAKKPGSIRDRNYRVYIGDVEGEEGFSLVGIVRVAALTD